jgi:hypothetical protein
LPDVFCVPDAFGAVGVICEASTAVLAGGAVLVGGTVVVAGGAVLVAGGAVVVVLGSGGAAGFGAQLEGSNEASTFGCWRFSIANRCASCAAHAASQASLTSAAVPAEPPPVPAVAVWGETAWLVVRLTNSVRGETVPAAPEVVPDRELDPDPELELDPDPELEPDPAPELEPAPAPAPDPPVEPSTVLTDVIR